MDTPVEHLVIEMRYEPTLNFYSAMDKIGLDLAKTYPDWERSPLTLEIKNKKQRRRCFLSYQRCFYESLGFSAIAAEIDQAQKLLDKVHHELGFTKVRRIGLRQWICAKSGEPFTQMVKATYKKFHPSDHAIHSIIRGMMYDVGYTFDVQSDNGWRYHLRFGPMEKKQWFEIIPHDPGTFETPDDFKNYKDSLPGQFHFIDIDCFKDDTTFSDVMSLLTSMRTVSAEIVGDLVRFLKG